MKKKINAEDVESIRYHDFLSEELVERIKKMHSLIHEVYPVSLDEWIDGFCYDMHPEQEVQIWEAIASRYESSCKLRGAKNQEEKEEVFRNLLVESGACEIEIVSSNDKASA